MKKCQDKAWAWALLAVSLMLAASQSAQAFATRQGADYDDNVPTGFLLADRTASGGDVVTGKWHADLDKCKAFAEANGIPLVAIWSNGDNCGHCKKWENNAISDAFIAWMKTSGIVFYFGYYGDPGKGTTLGEWCYWCGRGNPMGQTLPLVRLYWPKGGVDFSANGDTVDGNKGRCTISSATPRADDPYYVPGDYGTYNPGGRYMIDYIKRAFAAYDGSGANTYYGGEFAVIDDPNAGLQAIAEVTPRVNIPLWRTNTTSIAKAYTNLLWGVYPDGSSFTNTVIWTAGQKSQLVAIDITKNGRVSASDVGKAVRLVLYDNKKKKVADYANGVTIVSADAYPNSAANPLWIGERTADTLEFGEWTMDLDAVTNKVNAWNAGLGLLSATPGLLAGTPGKRAYSLIYVGGSRWCPDCVMTDRYFLDDERFKTWAATHNIALGVIDIPKDPNDQGGSPSLLTYNTFRASDNFVTGRQSWPADEAQRYQSGAPYISRKGILMSENGGTNATEIARRNKALVAQNTLNGGWNRPERPNQSRTGVPCFIALRRDGTIAGRWEFFSDLGPKGWSYGYLKRLEELLSQADESEESNQNWRTTTQTVAKRGTSEVAQLSHSDLVDTYKIDPAAVGQTVSFKISCASAIGGSLKVVQASDALEKTIGSVSGLFSDGIEVTVEIPETNCYLVVAADVVSESKPASPVSGVLSATTTNSTRCAYSIVSSNVVLPDDSPKTETPDDGGRTVTIAVQEGASYKITNVDDTTIADVFDKGVGEDIYVAKVTGSVTFGLKDKDVDSDMYSTTYQVWETGRVGFETAASSISESDNAYMYTLSVVRLGGASGIARATLRFDRDNPECKWIKRLDELGQTDTIFMFDQDEWGASDEVALEWASGDAEPKQFHIMINPNNNADGNLGLAFSLEKGESDAGLGISSFMLTIRDNDTANPGTLAIDGTNPGGQKDSALVAKGGEDVVVSVSRSGGSDGLVFGSLATTSGSFGGESEVMFAWDSRESGSTNATLNLPAYSPSGDNTVWVTLYAYNGAKTDAAARTFCVKLVPTDALSFEKDEVSVADAVRYVPIAPVSVAVKESLGTDWDIVSVRKFAGALPPGLSWRYDGEAHCLRVEGIPTQGGTYKASFRVYGGEEAGTVVSVTFDVADPSPASFSQARTYVDVPVMDTTTSSLAGLMTLTVPQSGRVSAKYRSVDGRTISYVASNWSEFSSDEFVAELSGVADTNETMKVTANLDGTVSVEFADPNAAGDEYSVLPQAADAFVPENWRGRYTVNLKQDGVLSEQLPLATGDGYVLLNMENESAIAGRMTYAGVLPNGKAFSGSGFIQPGVFDEASGEYATALLPVLCSGEIDSLSGVFSIKPYAEKEHKTKRRSVYAYPVTNPAPHFIWSHQEPAEAASYVVSLDAFGGFYNPAESLAECCEGTFATLDLMFFAMPEMLTRAQDFGLGDPLGWQTNSDIAVGVRFNETTGNRLGLLRSGAAKEAAGLTMNVNLATGIINGSFRLGFENGSVTALYRGVIMPGWGTGCGDCTLGNEESLERPFISGMFWFSDALPYTDVKGRLRTLSLKRGAPISIGVNPGE